MNHFEEFKAVKKALESLDKDSVQYKQALLKYYIFFFFHLRDSKSFSKYDWKVFYTDLSKSFPIRLMGKIDILDTPPVLNQLPFRLVVELENEEEILKFENNSNNLSPDEDIEIIFDSVDAQFCHLNIGFHTAKQLKEFTDTFGTTLDILPVLSRCETYESSLKLCKEIIALFTQNK